MNEKEKADEEKAIEEAHQKSHKELHRSLDRLLADYFANEKGSSTEDSLLRFMQWSCLQTKKPDHWPLEAVHGKL